MSAPNGTAWTVWPAAQLAVALVALSPPALGQDTVILSSSSGSGSTRITGRVLDYTGRQLVLELAGGRQQTYPAAQVVSVQTTYGRDYQPARAAFERGQFDQALNLYRGARDAETRAWVRRQIVAQMVWCYQALGQDQTAGDTFLLIARGEPTLEEFSVIPLAWITADTPGPLLQAARGWLGRDDLPAAVLLGASHLLNTGERAVVLEKLTRLASSSEPAIAGLAAAQYWRSSVGRADDAQLAQWEATIEKTPEPLRAGPCFVLGQARAIRSQWQASALALLRVPILYPQHRRLASRALLDAGRAMEQLGEAAAPGDARQKTDCKNDAVRLYREAVERYAETRWAQEANQRLQEMSAAKPPSR